LCAVNTTGVIDGYLPPFSCCRTCDFLAYFSEEIPLNMKQASYEKLISRSQQGIVAVLSVG